MKKLLWIIGLLVIGLAIGVAALFWMKPFWFKTPIKIGLLHSRTGVLAVNEQRMLDAELLAIDEINAQGGIGGHKLEPIVADGASNEMTFEKEALRLVTKDKVAVLVGCWVSPARKLVKNVVEKYNNLLLYPAVYEGLEESNNVIYLGGTPNQSLIPGITWCFNSIGKRFFLIGSDAVSSYAAHKIIELHVVAIGGEIVGQQYINIKDKVLPEHIKKIAELKPDLIINTISGDGNVSFFTELLNAGITSEQIPTMSFRTSQADFERFDLKSIIGAYVLFNYAAESSYPFNQLFIANFKKKYGQQSRVGDAEQSAYSLVHMWAQAYRQAASANPAVIVPVLKKIVYQAPSGIVYLAENNNCWQTSIISKLAYNGDLIPIWKSARNIRPEVYPPYLTKNEWNEFLTSLYEGWGKRWAA